MRIGEETLLVYMKQHNALSLGHRLASLFLPSAAMRSLVGAITLMQAGYSTAKPLAALEYRNRGVLIKSLYFSEEVSGAKPVNIFWHEDLRRLHGADGYRKRRAFLRALAQFLSSLHRKHIYHNDLNASNILIRGQEAPVQGLFNVIDLQGLRKCFYVSKRRRIKNLAQLERTLGRLLSHTEKLFFLKAYVEFASVHRRKKRNLINTILQEAKRQILKEFRRAAGRTTKSADDSQGFLDFGAENL